MSKLTNCQIWARIRGMEGTVAMSEARTGRPAVRTRKKLVEYRAELAWRLAVGESPGTEIQAVRHGESR
jgi:hypothetical protein